MQLFLDSANLAELQSILPWGIISGVTTNQKIFLAEKGVDFRSRVLEIVRRVNGPVSVELTSLEFEAMLEEALMFHAWAPEHIVIKVPMLGNGTGLRVTSALVRQRIRVNATTIMCTSQAVLAALIGATYVSVFFNRIKDAKEDPASVIAQSRLILERERLPAQILVGSIRGPQDVTEALVAGAHIVTVPYKTLVKLPYHAKSEETILEFDKAWKEFQQVERIADLVHAGAGAR